MSSLRRLLGFFDKRQPQPAWNSWQHLRRWAVIVAVVGSLLIAGIGVAKASVIRCETTTCGAVSHHRHHHYRHGDYGHNHRRLYPRAFVHSAKRAYVRYERRQAAASVSPAAISVQAVNAWWRGLKASSDCIAYYRVPKYCGGQRASGGPLLTSEQEWNILKGVSETVIVCGATAIVASGAATPLAGVGAESLCYWIAAFHFALWGF